MTNTRPLFRAVAAAALVAGSAGVLGGAGCAEPEDALVIIQNQQPTVDEETNACVVSGDATAAVLSGVYDIDLDAAYPYFVHPLVESRFPSVKSGGSGGIERNSVLLSAVRVEIGAPLDPKWPAGCPGVFDWPAAATLDPAQRRGLTAQGMQPCHARRIRQLIVDGQLSGDASQPVFFTLNLQVLGSRQGDGVRSNVFPFRVQVCAGCLQRYYPNTPMCRDAPKPNPWRGNVCNIAQDSGPVLCCQDDAGDLICPAPDL